MRANGIDFSYWAPEYEHVDTVDPISIEFVINRTNYGVTEDFRFRQHAQATRKVPVRETYFFYESTSPALAQLELATDLTRSEGYRNLWVDAEEYGEINVISSQMFRDVKTLLEHNRQEFPDGGLYCNLDFYYQFELYLNRTGPGWEWLAEFPLWIAAPNYDMTIDAYINGAGAPKWKLFRSGRWVSLFREPGTWTYWQTGFKGIPERYGIKIKKQVDENVFNGTPAELFALRGLALPNFRALLRNGVQGIKRIKKGYFLK